MTIPSLLLRIALPLIITLAPMGAADAAVFYWQATGNWQNTPPGANSSFTFTVGLDNGGSTNVNQSFNPATDLVYFSVNSGAFAFTVPPALSITAVVANYTTNASGQLVGGDATINGTAGSDSLGGASAPRFELDFTDNDPDFYGSDGNRYRFGWGITMSPTAAPPSVPEPQYLFSSVPVVLFALSRRRRVG